MTDKDIIQQGIAEGMQAALTFQDPHIGAYRIHCHSYKRGYSVREIVAETLGRSTGATKGRGGSMHIYSKKTNWYGGNGIVGAQMPVGAGIAFALKYKKLPNVTIASLGDGAVNQGQFFQAINMAELWKLPLIIMIENNRYGMGTSVQRASMNPKLFERGDVIPGLRIDGNNVFAVRQTIAWAKKYALDKGPVIVEFMTYRFHGHSVSDPDTTYRTREEIQKARKQIDPIRVLKQITIENKLATKEELQVINILHDTTLNLLLQKIEEETSQHVKQQVQQARKDPQPSTQTLFDWVYQDNEAHFKRGIDIDSSYVPESRKQ